MGLVAVGEHVEERRQAQEENHKNSQPTEYKITCKLDRYCEKRERGHSVARSVWVVQTSGLQAVVVVAVVFAGPASEQEPAMMTHSRLDRQVG